MAQRAAVSCLATCWARDYAILQEDLASPVSGSGEYLHGGSETNAAAYCQSDLSRACVAVHGCGRGRGPAGHGTQLGMEAWRWTTVSGREGLQLDHAGEDGEANWFIRQCEDGGIGRLLVVYHTTVGASSAKLVGTSGNIGPGTCMMQTEQTRLEAARLRRHNGDRPAEASVGRACALLPCCALATGAMLGMAHCMSPLVVERAYRLQATNANGQCTGMTCADTCACAWKEALPSGC